MSHQKFKGNDQGLFTEFMKDFIPQMYFFGNLQGGIIARAEPFSEQKSKYLENRTFFSQDGKKFFQLAEAGFGGSDDNHVIGVINTNAPPTTASGELFKEPERWSLYFDRGIYFRIINPRKYVPRPELASLAPNGYMSTLQKHSAFTVLPSFNTVKTVFVPLPLVRHVEYVLQGKDETMFIVDRPEYNWDYSEFRLFVRNPRSIQFEQVSLLDTPDAVVRYRDGGTTIIKTVDGTLQVPTTLNPEGFKGKVVPTFTDAAEFEHELVPVIRESVEILYNNEKPILVRNY